MVVRTTWYRTGIGGWNQNVDGLQSGIYQAASQVVIDPKQHVVRVVAQCEAVLLYFRSNTAGLNEAVPSPPQYRFTISHTQAPGGPVLRPIWTDVGIMDVSMCAVPTGHPPVAEGIAQTNELAVAYRMVANDVNTRRSDGSLLDTTHTQSYDIAIDLERLPLIGETGHLWLSVIGELRVLAEYESPF